MYLFIYFYLFVLYLRTLLVAKTISVEWKGITWMMNWKDLEGSGRGLILRHYPDTRPAVQAEDRTVCEFMQFYKRL
jgi:hypothetical protein